jgi:Domain of unknown function (DUF4342)
MTTPGVEAPAEPAVKKESHKVKGTQLLSKAKALVHKGNVRRITIKSDDGRTIVEMPLTIGVVGAVLLPMWVAIGAIAAMAADYTIEVERDAEPGE